ncbi:alcohol dehydrogenase [Allobranchiibius sp. GilTou38]|uniref:alcohol dehydrogenase n=1 Tax=Allobranchiibius sp. GilTou38 TaxID=2815210 RepID=UPI001AA0CA4A|nr:alcohol dehydrogenase [Allobranchiibius sp. GilTou38]MBO1766121.1 alcohol dehydrogenase catalytic domain-containing protein [Allobranchiibius sp. GilTou38]
MATVRAAQVDSKGGDFRIVDNDVREPGRRQVRITVEACGVCHSDAAFVHAAFPNVQFPLVTGHEIAGRIDALGEDVEGWEVGDRVEVGWFGGNCGHCLACREGDFINCAELQVPGWAYPGGYADSVIVPATALARIPEGMTAVQAAPMGCAGVTTYSALRSSIAKPGDLVAILGIGGLGHLGVQFAANLGFETVAIARGADKKDSALELGAKHYIDSNSENVAEALQKLGGAKVVLATAANADAMSATIDGLTHRGELIAIGAVPEAIQVSPTQLIMGSKTVHGHPSGTAQEVQETMEFAQAHGVRVMTEEAPLSDVNDAFAKMMSGEARYRMVLTTGN